MIRNILVAAVLLMGSAAPVRAQAALRALGGAGLGLLTAFPVTVGYATARAELGDYFFNNDEGLDQLIWIPPVLVGTGAVAALALPDRFSFGRTALSIVGGTAAGALLGRGVSQLLADTSPGRWAGLVIGMGVGAVAGGVIAFLPTEEGEPPDGQDGVAFSFTIPLGGRP